MGSTKTEDGEEAMILEQYYIECLSQASYLIGDETTERAVVVDPRRDISDYLADAKRYGLTIEGDRGVDRLRRVRGNRLPDPSTGRR